MADSRIVCTAGSLTFAYCDAIGQDTTGTGFPRDVFDSPGFQAWAFADPLRYQDRVRSADLGLWVDDKEGDEVSPIQRVYAHLYRCGDAHLPFILLIHRDREEPVRIDPRHRLIHGRGRGTNHG